jgi:hypothetical protein
MDRRGTIWIRVRKVSLKLLLGTGLVLVGAAAVAGGFLFIDWQRSFVVPENFRNRILIWTIVPLWVFGMFVLTKWLKPFRPARRSKRKAQVGGNDGILANSVALVVLAGMLAAVAGFPVYGLLIGINGVFRRDVVMVVEGFVLYKDQSGGTRKHPQISPYVDVRNEARHTDYRLAVDGSTYAKVKFGGLYREEFFAGYFGWPTRRQRDSRVIQLETPALEAPRPPPG